MLQMYNKKSKLGYITGKRIKICRHIELRISLDELADKIGERIGKRPKRQTISNWELGLTTPNLKQLEAMADIFDCDIAYLVGDIEQRHAVTSKLTNETGLSSEAINNLIVANKNNNPYIHVLSALLEDEQLLICISNCITADYGSISTFIEIDDPFSPKGKHPILITPRNIRQSDKMNLYKRLCKFIDGERRKIGLPSYDEL